MRKRENAKMAMEAMLIRAIAVSVMDGKAGTDMLKKLMRGLESND